MTSPQPAPSPSPEPHDGVTSPASQEVDDFAVLDRQNLMVALRLLNRIEELQTLAETATDLPDLFSDGALEQFQSQLGGEEVAFAERTDRVAAAIIEHFWSPETVETFGIGESRFSVGKHGLIRHEASGERTLFRSEVTPDELDEGLIQADAAAWEELLFTLVLRS